jgi:hypothetical protein
MNLLIWQTVQMNKGKSDHNAQQEAIVDDLKFEGMARKGWLESSKTTIEEMMGVLFIFLNEGAIKWIVWYDKNLKEQKKGPNNPDHMIQFMFFLKYDSFFLLTN